MVLPKRKSNRLASYDYSSPGAYFLTICTQNRLPILSEIVGAALSTPPTNALIPHYVSTLKGFCHRDIGEKIFQRSYHDHVIRDEKDYLKIWQYIDNNPAKWQLDCFYIPDKQRTNNLAHTLMI